MPLANVRSPSARWRCWSPAFRRLACLSPAFRRLALLAFVAIACTAASSALPAAEETDPRRPAAIEAQEVPVVPGEIFDRLQQYQNVRHAAFLGWSPDGRGMLIRTRFGNSGQLHRVHEPLGRREQITFFDEPVGGTFIPQATDGAIILSMSRGGDENSQLYLLDQAEFRTTLLTDGASRNRRGPFSHDGTRMIVHSNRRNGRDTDLYLTDARRPDSMDMLMEVDGEFWSATDWSQDGGTLALVRTVSVNEAYPALFDMASRQIKPIALPGDAKAAIGALAFAPDGKSVYLTTDARGEFQELARLDLATMQYTWLSEDIPWDVRDLEVDPLTGRVAFTTNEDGASRLFLLEGDNRRLLETPLGIVDSLEFSPDGARLGFTLVRPDAPVDAFSIDVADGRLTQWTQSEAGGLDPRTFVRPQRIEFASFDGRKIPAWYFRPPGATADHQVPVLIDIHGGPEGQYEPFFSGQTQYYAGELGLAVIYPNVRGSSGYGKTYLKLDNAELREDSVRDIGALLDWIAEQPELDASRVAVAGGSYGGYMVLASLVNYPDRIKAGIDIVGIANFITFLERTSPYRQDLRRVEYGDERDPAMRAVFERINPTSNADKIRSALLVAHGVNDPRVPFSEAQQIAEKVRSAGRPVWTVYAGNEGHGFGKKDNRDYLTGVEALFLMRHLGME
jgi:dipeptidyl aminopeptidase/acylaminoacyl peptidase